MSLQADGSASTPTLSTAAGSDLFRGGGEMGGLMRALDWAATPLGDVDGWPQSLRTMVRILLANRFPLLLWWGPELCQLYNDAYRPVLGSKHPRSLGQPASECWPEIWDTIGPLIATPFSGGPATWDDDIFLEVNRHGFVEETHFTIAYSPVPDDSAPGGIGGVLATVHEITRQVIEDRRMAALRDLSARSSEAKTAEAACQISAEALAVHPKDVPFALLYLVDDEATTARLAGAAGVEPGAPTSPLVVDLQTRDAGSGGWPLSRVATAEPEVVTNLADLFANVPRGPWSNPPHQAFVKAIPSTTPHAVAGVLVLGISAYLEFDERYRQFFELAAGQVATAIAHARAYEDERTRAEALAELDRAKTVFFSNVSHELRTPLTLLLGPLEDALLDEAPLRRVDRTRLEVAHRNALRLLRLVNTLLDFSRIEAGRMQATFVATDLAQLTAELASSFRSAIEQAGLRLTVDCAPLPAPVYVDHDMWEKIVLNLVSNAFKFTFEGDIRVALRPASKGGAVELVVQDTGVGIASEQLPRLFERFHRVQGARARTFEGTGIGLALVQELVRFHAGAVEVESEPGVGTTFRVTIPTGTRHLPAAMVVDAAPAHTGPKRAALYVDEAQRWAPVAGLAAKPAGSDGAVEGRVLVVDDNADMREYVARLLGTHFEVELAADGLSALRSATAQPPDLVLSDIMMPTMDGLDLLAALRTDPSTRDIPIILLSARAGQEATVHGLQTGADDYVIKPFTASELIARVSAHVQLTRKRAAAAQLEQTARLEAEAALKAHDEFLAIAAHELRSPIATVKGTAQMALRRHALDEQPRLRHALQVIVEVSDRLARLTEDLIDLSRLEVGTLALHLERLDLGRLLRASVEHLELQVEERYTLSTSIPTEPLRTLADANRLEQVLNNLLTNAIKYSPAGGTIEVSLRAECGGATVYVKDPGIGLAPDTLERIFDPFARATGAVQRNLPGLGLGLFISRRIVELHRGRIWAESEGDGHGTTLCVWLPLMPD